MSIELTPGAVYNVRHSSGRIKARFLGETPPARWRTRTHYRFLNLNTGREIILKSKQKIINQENNTNA